MPELSRFFGIIVRMFSEVGAGHSAPHFHAYYQDHVAVFAINPLEMLAGGLPNRQRRLVEAWAEIHRDEPIADWERLRGGTPALPIAPLQ